MRTKAAIGGDASSSLGMPEWPGDPRHQEGGVEHTFPASLRRNQSCQHLGLRPEASRDNKSPTSKPPCLWYFVTAAAGNSYVIREPQLTHHALPTLDQEPSRPLQSVDLPSPCPEYGLNPTRNRPPRSPGAQSALCRLRYQPPREAVTSDREPDVSL